MKIHRLVFLILFSTQFALSTSIVNAQDGNELYNLCSRFPLNSKCKGYEAPISLKDRLGIEAKCLISSQEEVEECKINLTEESVTFYLETGDDLNILDGQKDTQEIEIPLAAIKSFTYSERKKTDVGAVLAFGVFGLLSKKKTSTFNLRLEPSQENQENVLPKQAVFVTKRNLGREIRQSLEEKTNLDAEFLDLDL